MSQRYAQAALPPSHYGPVGYFDGRRVEPGGWRAWGCRQASLACKAEQDVERAGFCCERVRVEELEQRDGRTVVIEGLAELPVGLVLELDARRPEHAKPDHGQEARADKHPDDEPPDRPPLGDTT